MVFCPTIKVISYLPGATLYSLQLYKRNLVGLEGFEPSTFELKVRCSTTELQTHMNGGGGEVRTHARRNA